MFEKLLRWLRFNGLYLGCPPWDTGVSPPELTAFLDTTEPGSALDVGCGTGTNLLSMARKGWDVVGVDIAWLSVLRAWVKIRNAKLPARVIYGDITGEMNFSTPFDFIIDIGCYHSLFTGGRLAYRDNIRKWLKPGGTFMIYAHQQSSQRREHGITEQDLQAFQEFLVLQWREDTPEKRPDGSGGRPSTWARFLRENE